MRTQAQRIGSQWTLQVNRPTFFLKDNIYIDADWNKSVSDVGIVYLRASSQREIHGSRSEIARL